ncbi:MAG TPA: PDZ domain-containing protein, partial [Pirellulales bacterium]
VPRGALVTQVRPNTPASAIGLSVGDVVMEFDGIPVEDDGHLINMVSLTKAGRTVPMLVWRDRRQIKLNVRLAERAQTDMPK